MQQVSHLRKVQTAKVMPTVQITVSTQQITMSKTAVHQILRNRKQVITGADYNGEKEYHRFSHGNLYPHSILHEKNVITVISFPVRQVQRSRLIM